VAEAEAAEKKEFFVKGINWHPEAPITPGYVYAVKIRYKHRETEAELTPLDGGRAALKLHKPERGVTPGQILAVYDGEFLLGGAVIE